MTMLEQSLCVAHKPLLDKPFCLLKWCHKMESCCHFNPIVQICLPFFSPSTVVQSLHENSKQWSIAWHWVLIWTSSSSLAKLFNKTHRNWDCTTPSCAIGEMVVHKARLWHKEFWDVLQIHMFKSANSNHLRLVWPIPCMLWHLYSWPSSESLKTSHN